MSWSVPGRLLRAVIWLGLLSAGMLGLARGEGGTSEHPVYQTEITGMINPGALHRLQRAIARAEADHAAALVVRINTPGGLLSSTRDMVNAIAESRVPVIGYVGPSGASATSAGALILLSTHVAVMNAGTNLGASSPIAGDGSDIPGTLGKKIMNDSKAFMRSIANEHGRNADVAERFVSEAHSLTAAEALAQNVVDAVVADRSQLLAVVDGRRIRFHGEPLTLTLAAREIRPLSPSLMDGLLQYIAHPQIAHLLLSLGMLCLFIELITPGLALPGVVGAIAVVLGLIGVQTLPVNTGFLLLLALGVILMAVEYFIAGFGVLGIGGAIAFVIGSLNLFDGPTAAQFRTEILSVSVAVAVAMLLTTFLILRSFKGERGIAKDLAGKTGEAMVSFDHHGHVLVDAQRYPAVTDAPLHYGEPIIVVGKDETGRLLVRRA